MAEPNNQNASQQASNGAQSQAGAAASQPQSAQNQEPTWLSSIQDAAQREEAKKGWMLQADYTRKTQELSEQRKSWEAEQQKYKDIETQAKQYEDWWNKFKPTYDVLQKNWDKIHPILNGQQVNPQSPQNNGQGTTHKGFENFDVLPPEEQAQRIADYVVNQQLAQKFSEMQQNFNQLIAQKEQQLQNYLAILTDSFGRKFEDPSLDIPKYIAKATEFSYGKFNPMDLAYHALTDEQKLAKLQEDAFNKGKEQGLLEAKNNVQSSGAFNFERVPDFKRAPQSREQIKDAVRKLSIEKGFGWGNG